MKKKTIMLSVAASMAMSIAERDMRKEFGKDYIPMDATSVQYEYNPYDLVCTFDDSSDGDSYA